MELDITDAITKLTEEITMQVVETQKEFIFKTIHPYCENVLQIEVDKEELKQILLNGIQCRQTGHWDIQALESGIEIWTCSHCGWTRTTLPGIETWGYCPKCGAKMEKKVK